eukprot:7122455-Pyramimonas_sp.AAC.1
MFLVAQTTQFLVSHGLSWGEGTPGEGQTRILMSSLVARRGLRRGGASGGAHSGERPARDARDSEPWGVHGTGW